MPGHGVEEVQAGEVALGVERRDRDLLGGQPRLSHRLRLRVGGLGAAVAEVDAGEVGDGAHRAPSVSRRVSRASRTATTSMPSWSSPSTRAASSPSSWERPAIEHEARAGGAEVGDRLGGVLGVRAGAGRDDGDGRPGLGRGDATGGEQVGHERVPSTGVPLGPERADDDRRPVAERQCAVAQSLEGRCVAVGPEGQAGTARVATGAAGQRDLAGERERRDARERRAPGRQDEGPLGGGAGDPRVEQAVLERGDDATGRLDLLEPCPHRGGDLVGERLQVPRAAAGVGDPPDVATRRRGGSGCCGPSRRLKRSGRPATVS